MKPGASGKKNFEWAKKMTPKQIRAFIKKLAAAAKAARLKRDPGLNNL
jgi:hypothetical protein